VKDILLSDVFQLFGQGLIVGGLLSFIPFVIGFVIQSSLDFFRL
jgi:hypothetical protein